MILEVAILDVRSGSDPFLTVEHYERTSSRLHGA